MWKEYNNKLKKEFQFKDFIEAASFITKVSIKSEKYNHHPEIYNVYNKVEISLCTHDEGSVITKIDHDLA